VTGSRLTREAAIGSEQIPSGLVNDETSLFTVDLTEKTPLLDGGEAAMDWSLIEKEPERDGAHSHSSMNTLTTISQDTFNHFKV